VVSIKGNQDCTTVPGEAVRRCFDIAPATASGRNATITFFFAGSEIPAGQDCDDLNAYRWDGGTWQALTPGTRACGGDPQSLQVTGVTTFSKFVLKETAPNAVVLRTFGVRTMDGLVYAGLLLASLLLLAGGLARRRGQAQA